MGARAGPLRCTTGGRPLSGACFAHIPIHVQWCVVMQGAFGGPAAERHGHRGRHLRAAGARDRRRAAVPDSAAPAGARRVQVRFAPRLACPPSSTALRSLRSSHVLLQRVYRADMSFPYAQLLAEPVHDRHGGRHEHCGLRARVGRAGGVLGDWRCVSFARSWFPSWLVARC